MIAAIDSGNSSVKLGIFDQGKLIKSFYSLSIPSAAGIINTSYTESRIIVSDVGGNTKEIMDLFSGVKELLWVNSKLKFPFRILYKTPESLGSDRLAAVAGAWEGWGPGNLLVIDIGTCITYDFIDRQAQYRGGGISPGLTIRLKSLNRFTSALPEISPNNRYSLYGDDTPSSILSGTQGGLIAELNGMIQLYKESFPDLKIIMGGRNAGFFEPGMKSPVIIHPDLILWGLSAIARYNEKQQDRRPAPPNS